MLLNVILCFIYLKTNEKKLFLNLSLINWFSFNFENLNLIGASIYICVRVHVHDTCKMDNININIICVFDN